MLVHNSRSYTETVDTQSTSTRSALGTVRESELYGGVLSTSLSREHLAMTAEFLRGDE
jgi:ubiquinol-cytochrome c reductase core subunit 2